MMSQEPLSGKKVLIPRGANQAKSFSRLIEKYGGIPVEIPLLSFKPISLDDHLKQVLNSLESYDWIVFTSNTTVETFLSFFPEGLPDAMPKVAAIGERTGILLEKKGLGPHFVPTKYVAEVFAEEFITHIRPGSRVLIPKGNLAREHIAMTIRENGSFADEIVVYETYLPEGSKLKLKNALAEDGLDILMFTSPSTVNHFMEAVVEYGLREQADRCIVSCIGPVTHERLLEFGFTVHASPEQYTVADMVETTIDYLESVQ
ncbi:uroporphyrinogen-III synthase [Bacillus sp. FJAT-27225]|uniref:uroporphyrinogen-III synthase n=1 Tax=Bacillus sp. FJAT-27225 TaxID=1743144 RepID=UPI00080C2D43|nr:uroporphyrinogen-III synthase [Bacillus sp. FJAT-27225]OCA91277.1 uroporphyrinogen-III synthase [Bacillus sp. FJAT-27225]